MANVATHWPRERLQPDPIRIVAISASIALNAALLALLMRPPEFIPPPATAPHIQAQVIDVRPIQKPRDPLPIEKPRPQPTQAQQQPVQHQRTTVQALSQDPNPVGILVDPNPVLDTIGPIVPVLPMRPVEASLTAIASPAPTYPRDALREGIAGTVELELLVGVDGRVLEVRVTRSSGNRMLDNAAREQVRRNWRFQPAQRDGVAVQALGRVPIVFTLDGQ